MRRFRFAIVCCLLTLPFEIPGIASAGTVPDFAAVGGINIGGPLERMPWNPSLYKEEDPLTVLSPRLNADRFSNGSFPFGLTATGKNRLLDNDREQAKNERVFSALASSRFLVPESGMALLLGCVLITLACLGRKKFRKS